MKREKEEEGGKSAMTVNIKKEDSIRFLFGRK
jgi:hypothetical protein